jgi:putative heme iron utilization protein
MAASESAPQNSAQPRQHASTGPAVPSLPEPSHAERTRTLLSLHSTGTLSTQSRRHPGFPFGSLMPYALDPSGSPILLISNMAMHTHNLRGDAHASLFVGEAAADGDALGAARATLVGLAELVPVADLPAAREQYLAAHPGSRYWVDFADFHFFRIQPVELYYVGGFGVMGWVEATAYALAQPDPLAAAAPRILSHMNADHRDSMLLLAHTHGSPDAPNATDAQMTSVDRLGFALRLTTPSGMHGIRLNFPRAIADAQQARSALVEMVETARKSQLSAQE